MRRVFCLEGVHGTGKSTLISKINSKNIFVMPEEELEMPRMGVFEPTSAILEMHWMNTWFQKLMEMLGDVVNDPDITVILADRSPWSVAVYASTPDLRQSFTHIINDAAQEFASHGVHFHLIRVTCSEEVLVSRLKAKLSRDDAMYFMDSSVQHMREINKRYDGLNWFASVDVTENDGVEELVQLLKT
jgi:deoxyadenosine/deoxycytidine kinase